jgi:hypothetical protein
MTEAEWLASDNLPALFIHLRGTLTPEQQQSRMGLHSSGGVLVDRPASNCTAARMRTFAGACVPMWLALPLDPPSREVMTRYSEFLTGLATWEAFCDTAQNLHHLPRADSLLRISDFCCRWNDTPAGVAHMVWDLSSITARYAARDEIAALVSI